MPITPVPAPPAQPTPHGLLETAMPSPAMGPGSTTRWELGITFVPENCGEPELWVIPCAGPGSPASGATLTTTRELDDGALTFIPYLLRRGFLCDTQQLRIIDFEARARATLEAGQCHLMEAEFYTGTGVGWAANNADPTRDPFNLSLIDDTAGTVIDATAQAPSVALRLLVEAAGNSPGGHRSMIHATPGVAMAWAQGGGIRQDRDGRLVTTVGNHWVVSGTGYTGNGPADAAPAAGVKWAWVTSPVYYLLGDIEVLPPHVDQRDNDVLVVAQRPALAYFDGCLLAGVPVDQTAAV